tara:strand:- start:228 stop:578 length:351 start_codon:yes stop_codon:yes gene_type:complete
MKKIIITLIFSFGITSQAQDKLTIFGEASSMSFARSVFNLDSRYKINKKISLSNWSTFTQGRTIDMGGDYIVSSTLINFNNKKRNFTFSTGHQYLTAPLYDRSRHDLVIKIRFKIL